MEEDKQRQIGYVMIFVAGALWGCIGIFVSILTKLGAASVLIAFLRIAVGFILLIPLVISVSGKNGFKIDLQGLMLCLVLGVFSQAFFNITYIESIENVGVATASVLLYTAPIFVTAMSAIFLKETLTKQKIVALAINVLGCTLTVTGGNFNSINFSVHGVVMGISAGFLYALMTIFGKITSSKNYNPVTIVFYSFLFGSIVLAFFAKPWDSIQGLINVRFIMVAIGFGLIPTAGSYFFYMKGLSKNLQASKVPIIASVETVVAAIIGMGFLGEARGFIKIVGILCVVLSISVMSKQPKQEEQDKSKLK